MKEIKMYQCEICKYKYETLVEAIKCEKSGKEIPLAEVGQLVDYEVTVGGGFNPFYVELKIRDIEDRGHFLVYHFDEYDEEDDEWYESDYCTIGVYGNDDFKKKCKIK